MKKSKVVLLVTVLCLLFSMFGSLSVNAYMYAELGNMDKLNQQCLDASITYTGDMIRVANILRKAERGEDLMIAFIGGSITYGSGMIDRDGTTMDRFSEHVQAWFREKYPDTICRLTNAGLPATGSMIGVFRSDYEVFEGKPDLLVIEYAVNEGSDYGCQETSEALLRKTIAANSGAAVMFLNMATDGGAGWGNPEGKLELAKYYGFPCISWRDGVNKAFDLGLATKEDFDADGVHPNKNGQAAMGMFINNYLDLVRSKLDEIPTEVPALPEAKYTDDFAYTKHLKSNEWVPTSLGNFLISEEACMYGQFKNGWTVAENGDPFTFECEAKRLYIPYQRTANNDGVVKVKVNGVPVAMLCGYTEGSQSLNAALVFQSETTKKITVEVEHVSGGNFAMSGIWIAY